MHSLLRKISLRTSVFLSLFLGVFVGIFLFSDMALAAQNGPFGINYVGSFLPLGGEDIWTIAAKIIRIFLSLLGLIAISLILYAGFTWMTSGGNEEKIASAKKILVNASIGLAIILSSLAITQFILKSLGDATGSNVDGENPAFGGRPAPACQNIADCQLNGGIHECGDDDFVVKSLTPRTPQNDGTGMSDVVVRAVFSRPLDGGQDLTKVLTLTSTNNPVQPKDIRIKEGRQIVEAVYARATPLCQDLVNGCLTDGEYKIEVNPDLTAGGVKLKTRLSCGEFDSTASFTVNKDFLDNESPDLLSLLFNGKKQGELPVVPRGRLYRLAANFGDRRTLDGGVPFGGISYMTLKIEGDPRDAAVENVLWNYFTGPRSGSNGTFSFSHEINLGASSSVPALYTLTFTTGDIDNNTLVTSTQFILDGELCHNGRQDEGETGIDIGGLCLGDGACNANWQCVSGLCENGFCVNKPVITNVEVAGSDSNAWKSSPGSWVSIIGRYFGEETGDVYFGNDQNNNGIIDQGESWVQAPLAACNGLDMWKDSVIVVEVPNIAVGATTTIRVKTKALDETPSYEDITNDDRGPKAGPNQGLFVINNDTYPGLCAVVGPNNTNVGTSTAPISAFGRKLGNGANSALLFGDIPARSGRWGDQVILSNVPQNMQNGRVSVKARIGDIFTNGVPFTVVASDENSVPTISSVSPTSTTRESLITLVGNNFGESGHVFLSDTRQAAIACASANVPGAGCFELSFVGLPQQCGNTWSNTQIIGKIPKDGLENRDYFVVVKNNFENYSDGTITINIHEGDPMPGICRIEPNKGPAPLSVDASPLQVVGINLKNSPELYYWTVGANDDDLSTWLNSSDDTDPRGQDPIRSSSETVIQTTLPIHNGISMISGPIKAKIGDNFSNGVNYTVENCLDEGSLPPGENYQCCSEGLEKGSWKPAGYACAGQVKSAGYVWRFTSGFIPNVPRVVEACSVDDWDRLDVPFVRPSPSPWKEWNVGDSCVNSIITVQFTLPMGAENLNQQNIRVYTCGDGVSPDCTYNNNDNVTGRYTLGLLPGQNNLLEFHLPAGETHAASTWHRVILSSNLHADAEGNVIFNRAQRNTQKLAMQRPLDDGFDDFPVAYYFDFKTGAQTCSLLGAGITPPSYTARMLGMLQQPGEPLSENLDHPTHPYYYYVWGRGNQACSVIDVNGLGWNWGPVQGDRANSDSQYAFSLKSDNTGVPRTSTAYAEDIRATVTALKNTDLAPADITASIDTVVDGIPKTITGTSSLTIDLGDPTVVDYWPQCNDSCVNATIGVRFNRPMVTSTYRSRDGVSGIRIQKCGGVGENCTLLEPVNDSIDTEDVNSGALSPFLYEVNVQSSLELGQLYLVTVTDQIKSIGRYNWDGSTTEGAALVPKVWKFRTKMQDGMCVLDRVDVLPNPFYATLIGQKTAYTASALSAPDQCSSVGQRLNPWFYGWNWSVEDNRVATVTHLANKGNPQPYCTRGCVPAGSDAPKGSNSHVCGNNQIDPGEDCDIALPGETPGVNCTLSCLRPGNNNKTNTTTVALACGNSLVEEEVGEECDPGIPEMKEYCSDICTWKGSSVNFTDNAQGLQCGNGLIGLGDGGNSFGEECDIELGVEKARRAGNIAWSGVGCSESCLHEGTPLSRSYCEDANSKLTPEQKDSYNCRAAVSICGDGLLELGEECEAVNTTTLRVKGVGGNFADINVENAFALCSNYCIFKNICEIKDRIDEAYVCEAGTPGCSDECTLRGSSPLYGTPSLCGDGDVGIGENAVCETDSDEEPIGQNPIQVVEAIGLGEVDAATKAQNTTITARAVAIRKTSTTVEDVDVSGSGAYGLQCGYVEYSEPKIEGDTLRMNNCPNANDGVANNSCCLARPQKTDSYPAHGSGILGGGQKVCINTYIEATFDTLLDQTALDGKVAIAHFLPGAVACQNGEQDITEDVNTLLTAREIGVFEGHFFAKVWNHIKEFFVAVFKSVVKAEIVPNSDELIAERVSDGIWCTGQIVPTLTHIKKQDLAEGEYSAVSIKINNALDPNSIYAVILKAGNQGLRSLSGVGIRGKALFNQPNVFGTDDVFVFETGDELCRIQNVVVDPPNHLYIKPSENFDFSAQALSTNGQIIQGTPGYQWTWNWEPKENDLFTFAEPTNFEIINISSTELEGNLSVSAQAMITEDRTPESNQQGNIYAGMSELTSLFCQNPWPNRFNYPYEDGVSVNTVGAFLNRDGYNFAQKVFDNSSIFPARVNGEPQYFNFSIGYCADFGDTKSFADDLPLLQPLVQGHLVNPNNNRNVDTGNLPAGTYKKFLFFNQKNDDVVGIQIFENSDRKSIRDWYISQNLGGLSNYRDISIEGYEGITDGNNYYINALNDLTDRNVENFTYLFSINSNAQQNTRQVLDKVISSLRFNINLPERNNCIEGNPGADPLSRQLPLNIFNLPVTNIRCESDFDCRTPGGLPKPNTIGVCANVKTKLHRDWQRLNSIQKIQTQIEDYRAKKGEYPQLPAGTYIPNYTNMHWPSWSKVFTSEIGNIPEVPLDKWSACGVCERQVDGKSIACNLNEDCGNAGGQCVLPDDMQTCWRSNDASFVCPALSNVLEYKTIGQNSYLLYLTLEYFNNTTIDNQQNIIAEFVSTTRYVNGASCNPLQVRRPVAGACGDGILNAGEECDPPGTASSGGGLDCGAGQASYHTCNNVCHYDAPVCRVTPTCGNSRIDQGEECDDGAANGSYGHCTETCTRPSVNYCGDGVRNYKETNNIAGKQDEEGYVEFCDRNEAKFLNVGFCSNTFTNCRANADCGTGTCLALNDGTYHIRKETLVNAATGAKELNKCATDCQSFGSYCGDGVLNPLYEQCDDGNTTDIDGCSAVCKKENIACAKTVPEANIGFDTAQKADGSGPRNHTVITIEYNNSTESACLSTTGEQICRGFGIEECVSVTKLVNGALQSMNCTDRLEASLDTRVGIRCQGPRPNAPVQNNDVAVAACGNSRIDQGEECDMGAQNGILCTATYGASCTYCSADCTKILTKDADRLCGNGKIDVINDDIVHPVIEACDTDPQTQKVVIADPVREQFLAGYASVQDLNGLYNAITTSTQCTVSSTLFAIGSVRCVNSCQALDTTDCIGCGKYGDEGRATPKIAVLNVLTPKVPNNSWGNQSNEYHYAIDHDDNPNTPVEYRTSTLPQFHRSLYLNPKLDNWSSPGICQSNAWADARAIIYYSQSDNCAERNADGTPGPRYTSVECKRGHRKYVKQVDQRNYMLSEWMCNDGSYYPLDRTYGYEVITNINENDPAHWVWGNYTENIVQIESNAMCNGQYSVYFGGRGIQEERGENYAMPASAQQKKSFLDRYGDFFPYAVNNEAREVKNTYVLSPAVPEGSIRVVVRWKDTESSIRFTGLVYNSAFRGLGQDAGVEQRQSSVVSYISAKSLGRDHICSEMIQLNKDAQEAMFHYWIPVNCLSSFGLSGGEWEIPSPQTGGVFVHDFGKAENTNAMAMTILTKDILGRDASTRFTSPYAFVVQAITQNGTVTSLASLEDDPDLTVDVYEFHQDQVPEYSMYLPTHTYKLNAATRSNNQQDMVKYWHVFNLVMVGSDYAVRDPRDIESQREYSNGGVLSTDFVDVLCHVPGEPRCLRGE